MFEKQPPSDGWPLPGGGGGQGCESSWLPPGVLLRERLADGVEAVVGAATAVGPFMPRLSGSELSDGLAGIDQMRAHTETLTLRVVMEALGRGLHTDTGLSAHNWLALRCPWLSPPAVGDLVTVAQGLVHPLHIELRDRVLATELSVRRAALVLRALSRVKPFMGTEPANDAVGEVDARSEYEKAVGSLLGVAGTAAFSEKDLRAAADCMASAVLPEKDHETREKSIHELRGVNESSLADGSLIRFIVNADTECAALIRSILNSPLAAPCPDDDGPDERTATQRRHDALFTVLKRGVAGADSAPTTPKAAVNVTIAWDVVERVFAGTGRTDAGDVLSPETVRRMACDADIIPIVLGTDREILEMGRSRRLVTPGQRRALHHRDKHCTFPGCTVPASWCDSHHVVHWAEGGLSDLSNYALLCGRHHSIVHSKGFTADVDSFGVTWHV